MFRVTIGLLCCTVGLSEKLSKSDVFFRYTPITTPHFGNLHSTTAVLLPSRQYAYRRNDGQ